LTVLALVLFAGALWGSSGAAAEKVPKVGPVKINLHPMNLQGKTVLLRWNGKMNGDKFLIRVGELLTQQVKDVKIIKLWEVDKNTATIPKNLESSEQVAATVAKLKPDLVIAMQAD
jgi:hypothetical protein